MSHLRGDEARIQSGVLMWTHKRLRLAPVRTLVDALRHSTCLSVRSTVRRQIACDAFNGPLRRDQLLARPVSWAGLQVSFLVLVH